MVIATQQHTKDKVRAASKSTIIQSLAEATGLSKKQVGDVLAGLTDIVRREIGRKGPGVFAIPGLLKITKVHKPATKARKGINPFTKEETTFAAKPARNVVKIRPLKNLKDMVA